MPRRRKEQISAISFGPDLPANLDLAGPPPAGTPKDGELKRKPLPDTFQGIKEQVDRMKVLAKQFSRDSVVRKVTEHVLLSCSVQKFSGDTTRKDCAIISIFDWAKDHFQFVNDPVNAELLKTPRRMIADLHCRTPELLKAILGPDVTNAIEGRQAMSMQPTDFHKLSRMSGDCDDAALLLASMLMSVGIQARFRLGGKKSDMGECHWHHIWVQALCSRGWVDMDITRGEATLGWYWPSFACTEVQEIPA